MKLHLADGLSLPVEAVTQTVLVVGKRGSGKSNTAARIVEQLHAAGCPFVVLDPVDNWWGLKASRDGRGEGLKDVYVFGGGHADLPLEPGGGELMADVLCDHRSSMVLSVKHFTGGERSRFMTAFALRVLRRWAGGVLHDGDGNVLGRGELAILRAVAQHDGGITRDQLTVLTGYKRSSRDTYLQRLTFAGLVAAAGDRLVATDAGVDRLGPGFEPLPTGDALREYWMQRLPEGERKILEVLVEGHPEPVERETLSEATGYQRSSRDTYLQRLRARRLVEVYRDGVRASDMLFG